MIFLRLRNLREDEDLPQWKLAEYLHVHQTTYSDYERGTTGVPIEVLDRLADLYRTSVDYLLGRTDVREAYPARGNADKKYL